MKATLSAFLLSCISLSAADTIFVSIKGDDSANGLASTLSGNDGPVASLQSALARAAEYKAREIRLLPGHYELKAPVEITYRNSGTSDQPLLIHAQEGAKVVLSGGRKITGWKRDTQNAGLWRAEVPEVKSGQWEFRQLFVNGERKIRARTPNNGFFRIQGASPQDKPVKLNFKPGDIKKHWAVSGDVEVIALLAWADIRMQIRSVDEGNSVATLSGDPRPSNKENDAQYYVENAAEFLDTPGEWYLDRKSGIVSYWARDGEDLASAEVIAPRLQELINFQGESGHPVQHVTLRGLQLSHTDWKLGTNGYADTQAAVATKGELRAEYAENVRIEGCTFSHLAGYAIDLGRSAKHFRIVRNKMVDLGGGGVRIGETAIPKSPADECHSHVITDNHIHQLGRIYPPAVGVFILQSGTNRVAHNDIHDLYYTAISVGWQWGYNETPCRENIIEFNHLHDIGQNLLSDMGAVYTLGPQRGTVIRNNLIHDVSAFTYGGWGLYTDEGSSDIVLENNIVYRCKNAGFHQHYGKENVVRNNVFAFNVENQIMRTRPEAHSSFTFTNNIVCFDSGNLLGSNWSNDNYRMGGNIYFDTRQAKSPEKMKFAGITFEEWKKRGHDQNSMISDPQFVAPERFDFRLKESSPALKLGFKPIDLSSVGIRKQGPD
ncbi:MAG TPA: right-handed parallel beta-helix repeat-containing protein [Verrucomicrobiae bacterium]